MALRTLDIHFQHSQTQDPFLAEDSMQLMNNQSMGSITGVQTKADVMPYDFFDTLESLDSIMILIHK
ncbi:hypothetical protein N7539_000044 [Penicillium diatomitis]|uniref:Uncharacterized protein n=1 Tax=Penicillium diatomitis TaxID=2819901 RepID=A0A9W9XL16_9EURO|nr:uncharacterized protein N7539_000044 [Penicillium diatomitis]KAJ5494928.1 hypothetical protein N7539_000044 [Penicillium diatomitis]